MRNELNRPNIGKEINTSDVSETKQGIDSIEKSDSKSLWDKLSELLDVSSLVEYSERNIRTEAKQCRDLTNDEKTYLTNTLCWSDKQIEKCSIDEKGIIQYRTDNCDLEGKTSETGVRYERKHIEINGIKIEGVFPEFHAQFETKLSEDKQKSRAYAIECNKDLKTAVNNDLELKSRFTDSQLNDINDGRTPTGYVWHHNEEPGKMQLVKQSDHQSNRHTGGNAIWGPDSIDKLQKGEIF